MKTINLKGKEYAPVSARVEQFHKDYADGSITTETTFSDGHVIVKATITFGQDDMSQPSCRTFTGHSYGKVGTEKAFEKLETTAVGRALAFAGYLAGGEIASYDEMEEFIKLDLSVEDVIKKLHTTTTLDELKMVYTSLPAALRNDNEVLAKKDEMKEVLTNK